MGTRPRPRYAQPDRLSEVISAALEPLTDEIKEVKETMRKIELTFVSRTDVYDRTVMDEKLGKLMDEIKNLKASIDLYRLLGIGALIVTLYVAFVSHVSLH